MDAGGGSVGLVLKRSGSSQIHTSWDPSTLDTRQLVLNASDDPTFATVGGIKRESSSRCVSSMHGLRYLLGLVCIGV